MDMQADSRTGDLAEPLFSAPEMVMIFPPPNNDKTGERNPHFVAPIVPDPIQDDRPPINLFVQGTTSRVVLIRAFLTVWSL